MHGPELDSARDEFAAWVQQVLQPRVLARQVRVEVFRRAMESAEFLPEILEKQASQKEFSLPIWEYLEIAASDERARKGRKMLREYRDLLNRIESRFGVEPEVVVAIWGLETGYGVVRGTVPVVSALATLAFRGRRAAYFEDELVAALRVSSRMKCTPGGMVGSWAGAIGHGQFMPSSIRDFAVDIDGDGQTNLCGDDPTDALGSIANYLAKHGWKQGQPWGFEVRLPDGFDYARSGLDLTLPTPAWSELGVTTFDGGPLPDYGPGSILLPAGARGVSLLVLRNFHVITSYNKSEAYALGIGHLSDRIAGGKPFHGSWPSDEPGLTQSEIETLQMLLTQAGFDTQGVDGLRGPNTTRAARAYQVAQGLVPDGHLSRALFDRLRRAQKPAESGE